MRIATKYCGTVECPEDGVIGFAGGLPGFESLRRFACIEQPDRRPLVYLQSLDQPDLCFLALPIDVVCPDYELDVSSEDLALLGFPETHSFDRKADVICLAIIAVDPAHGATANLLAPVVINYSTGAAAQVIQFASSHSPRHALAPAMEQATC
jgi:flagellar assembly factor FliW